MTRPYEPDDDHLDWDSTTKPGTRVGESQHRMRMYHTDDDTVETVPYEPDAA